MNTPAPADLLAAFDAYLADELDEAAFRALDDRLRTDVQARDWFVRYCELHTHLSLELRGRRAADRAVALTRPGPAPETARPRTARWVRWATGAAVLLLVGASAWMLARWVGEAAPVAWLVNAQDCRWADGTDPGNLKPGSVLQIERGLAEVRFASGAAFVLEGPAELELLGPKAARLLTGKLTARVPPAGHGFAVFTPDGKVIDLGTEFGMAVEPGRDTEVVVFRGEVQARPTGGPMLSLTDNQAARLAGGGVRPVETTDGKAFVRAIIPPPVILPRGLGLKFEKTVDSPLHDRDGRGTGFTHRLPGTGSAIPGADPRLRLDTDRAELDLTTTNSDINKQTNLSDGEYFGFRLTDLGFTGPEDFEISARLVDIPALRKVGQFGVYAGARSDRVIRGGLISKKDSGEYTQFHVNNDGGIDTDSVFVGLSNTGDEVRLTLRRIKNKYSLTAENLSAGNSSTLTTRHPVYLDGCPDLYVGVFGANTQSNDPKTLRLKEVRATVWAVRTP